MREDDIIEFDRFSIKCLKIKEYSIEYEIYLDNEIIFNGHVKWDGCSNWQFINNYFHGCTSDDLLNIGKVLEKCWFLTEESLPKWDF